MSWRSPDTSAQVELRITGHCVTSSMMATGFQLRHHTVLLGCAVLDDVATREVATKESGTL